MPSLFEGLPFILVEAQAAGIHCLVSDTVSQESDITGLIDFKSLAKPAEVWAMEALNLASQERIDVTDKLIDAGFSSHHSADTVKSIINGELSRL